MPLSLTQRLREKSAPRIAPLPAQRSGSQGNINEIKMSQMIQDNQIQIIQNGKRICNTRAQMYRSKI